MAIQNDQPRKGFNKPQGNRRGVRPEEEDEDSENSRNPLHDLFLEELADISNAERQLVKALPQMMKAARSEELRAAFEDHLEETREHALRLEEVAASLDESLKNKKCKAMEGLIAEAQEMIQEHKGQETIDAVLIAAAQKVEHYEIAAYGTVAEWARQMNHDDALELLVETLEEEKAADEKLTEIAKSLANLEAESSD